MNLQDRPILDMQIDFENYFQKTAPQIIQDIKGDEPAKWGIMTPHHMLEHLSIVLNFATGKLPMPLSIAEEKLPRMREFLYSEYGMPQNFKPPFLPADETLPLLYPELNGSKQHITNTIQEFLEVISAPGFTVSMHPFYGELNKKDWLVFQYKHFSHHFMQFGLV